MTNPVRDAALEQIVYLAGQPSPGFAEVIGAGRDHDWQTKKGAGAQGAIQTYRGQTPIQFKIKVTIGWDSGGGQDEIDAQFDSFNAWIKPFQYDGTKSKAITGTAVKHPALDELVPPVTSIICHRIGQRTLEAPGGPWSYTIDVEEFRPPAAKNATQTPDKTKGTSGNAGGNPPPGAQPDPTSDKQQQEIQKLLQEAQAP